MGKCQTSRRDHTRRLERLARLELLYCHLIETLIPKRPPLDLDRARCLRPATQATWEGPLVP